MELFSFKTLISIHLRDRLPDCPLDHVVLRVQPDQPEEADEADEPEHDQHSHHRDEAVARPALAVRVRRPAV